MLKESLLSVIIPVFNEESQIKESLQTVARILIINNIKYEFIIINDGSKDNTWGVLKNIASELPNIHAISLSRNFGKEASICAGLEIAKGDACIIMDADLQHPPEIIPKMYKLWKEEKYEVVEGVKVSRGKEPLFNKISAISFYKLLHKISGFNLNMASDFKLLDAKVVSAWKLMPERNTFFRGMSAWLGYKRTSVSFEVAERKTGISKWSIFKLFKLAVNAISSFSAVPLQLVTFMGVIFFIGSILLGLQTLYMKIRGIAFSGFTTVILLLLITGSAIMISLGIIGIYIAKIYDEIKMRPRYLVDEEVFSDKSGM
jgi:dolichol-phosphate mannosyltransferase